MSHLVPRPAQRPAHCRARSNSQPADKRSEIVGKLEDCIGEILEATKAYKTPQQQSAHQNANHIFQQRMMASQGRMGNMSDQDWLGTMMQCLNESMKTQQSSFVRNTSLDVALKVFASGVFDALGLAYFQEAFDRYAATPKINNPNQVATGQISLNPSGIPSPPRELGPSHSIMQRPGQQQVPPPPPPTAAFPSAHHQITQRLPNNNQVSGMPMKPFPMYGMPSAPRAPPPGLQQNRPMKRPFPTENTSIPARKKRTYTSEALRQAAGSIGPPPPVHAGHTQSQPSRQRLCIEYWNVQQERDIRRRQAILGYGGKWYVFQCHHHQDVLFFKTAEGARHHMITHHALPHQHIDFLDIVQELGVEVMNCDVARAEKNNLEAVNMWNRLGATSQNTSDRYVAGVGVQAAVQAPITTIPKTAWAAPHPVMLPPPPTPNSPSVILLSDDETSEQPTESQGVIIKQEPSENQQQESMRRVEEKYAVSSAPVPEMSPERLHQATHSPEHVERNPSSVIEVTDTMANTQGECKVPNDLEIEQGGATAEKTAEMDDTLKGNSTEVMEAAGTAMQIPDLTPDSPESSDLSEPPSLEELGSFEPLPTDNAEPKVASKELEDGEIDESCIQVAAYSPMTSDRGTSSPESTKKRKRRISAAGSALSNPLLQRKKLPSTPRAASKKKTDQPSLWSPPQQTGPSAHDQFKTKACKKCTERFYFRAQLATHMRSEHPDVIIVE